MTCCSRPGSPETAPAAASRRFSSRMPLASASGRTVSIADSMKAAGVNRPDVETHLAGGDAAHVEQILDELGLRARVALDRLEPRAQLGLACGARRRKTCDQPRIAVSGVRSSWERFARNSSLMRARPLGVGARGTLAVEQPLALFRGRLCRGLGALLLGDVAEAPHPSRPAALRPPERAKRARTRCRRRAAGGRSFPARRRCRCGRAAREMPRAIAVWRDMASSTARCSPRRKISNGMRHISANCWLKSVTLPSSSIDQDAVGGRLAAWHAPSIAHARALRSWPPAPPWPRATPRSARCRASRMLVAFWMATERSSASSSSGCTSPLRVFARRARCRAPAPGSSRTQSPGSSTYRR